MGPRKITRDLSVAAQIRPEDVAAAADLGFRAIVCNRPDGEDPDQPAFEEIAAAARAEGLEARYLPVASGKVSDADAAAFDAALAELPKPVLAYCRSGARSATLWALAEAASGHTPPHILERARGAD